MVDFAPLVSGKALQHLYEQRLIQDTVIVDCRDVVDNPDNYDWLIHEHLTVIVNNGIEAGKYPASVREIEQATEIVDATYVVWPDVPDDGISTLTLFRRAQNFRSNSHVKVIGVMHGTTTIESMMCAIALREMGADALALPSNLTDNLEIGSRLHLCRRIDEYMTAEIGERLPIYLFGGSSNKVDDLKTAMHPAVKAFCNSLTHLENTPELANQIRYMQRCLNGRDD